jgi:DNA polymerase I-like protein with 3'-5' exonuclease and polymerase domains
MERKRFNSIPKLVAPYKVRGIEQTSLEEVISFLKKQSTISLDIETTGLSPTKDQVIMVQVGNKHIQYIIDSRHIDISPIFPYLESNDIIKIGTNLKFEYKMFLGNYGIRIQNLRDIMIQEMILMCGIQRRGFNLQKLAEKYLDVHLPKDVRLEFTTLNGRNFNSRQIRYGANDILYPIYINELQQKKIKEQELEVCVHLENSFVKIISEMEFNGMLVDTEKWMTIYERNKVSMAEALEDLNQYLIDNSARPFIGTINMFTGKPTISVNWSSDRQVVEVFKYFKIPTKVLDKNKSKEVSKELGMDIEVYKDTVGAAEIERYKKDYPLVSIYLKYKKLEKSVDTFGQAWIDKYVDKESHKVHTNFWQILNTGRMSSNNPNVQQIKRGELRTCFPASQGNRLIVRDYSNQEGRLIADMADEKAMINEFLYGSGDLHSLTGTKVFSLIEGKPVTVSKKENADLRYIAKTVNFGSLYGIGPYKLAKNLQIESELAEQIINGYFKSYPDLTKYFKKWHKFATEKGYILIDEFTKRRSYFPFYKDYLKTKAIIDDYKYQQYEARKNGIPIEKLDKSVWSDFFTMKGTMERASQNYRIQGGSASMTKIAMVMMYNYLLENKLFDRVKLILALHDEIVLEAKENLAEHIDVKLEEFMTKAGKYFSKQVPMDSDGGPCDLWEH